MGNSSINQKKEIILAIKVTTISNLLRPYSLKKSLRTKGNTFSTKKFLSKQTTHDYEEILSKAELSRKRFKKINSLDLLNQS